MSQPNYDWHYSGAVPEVPQGAPDRIGPYEIRGELARGGMGAVFRGWDPQLGREVAIKALLQSEDGRLERFRREAETLARLRHPNVVPVHAVEVHDGQPYLVMKLLEGEDLRARISREGPLPVREAAELVVTLARALQHAHAHHVLHRDVKPSNVLLTAEGPVLTDFGLARDTSGEHERLTQTGTMLGTPGYMSPEQAGGKLDSIDARTDVWGLGATLYTALTGEPPFTGGSMLEVVVATHESRVVPPRELRAEVPASLEAVCLKALNKAPADRHPDAAALAEELEACFAGGGAGKRLVLAGIVAAGLLVGLAVSLATRSPIGEQADAPDPATTTRASPQSEPVVADPKPAPEEIDPSAERVDAPLRMLTHPAARKALFVDEGTKAVVIGDAEASFWNLDTGERIHTHRASLLEDLKPSPARRRVAYGGASRTVWIADARTGELQASVTLDSYLYAIAWSPDGEQIAAGGRTGTISIVQLQSEQVVQTLEHPNAQVMRLAFSPDGSWLCAAIEPRRNDERPLDRLPSLFLYERAEGGYALSQSWLVRSKPGALLFDPTGTSLYVGDRDGYLSAYPLTDERERPEPIVFADAKLEASFVSSRAHAGRIHGAILLDERRLISVSERSQNLTPGVLKLWDRRTGALLGERFRDRGGYHDVDLSPDGRRLLLCQNHGDAVEVWSIEAALGD